MIGVMDSINELTEIVGQNRMELLLFRLSGLSQRYGINVFKVREVLPCPHLTVMPKLQRFVIGVAHIRGQTLSVIDLAMAIGGKPTADVNKCFIIIAEYNRSTQAFLVSSVERILNMNWNKILPPPKGAGHSNYMTAVTEIDGELVEILDVEMPEMDGYTLCANIRQDPSLKRLYVILHTSLSGVFNISMVGKAGANDFIPKFNSDDLAQAVKKAINIVNTGVSGAELLAQKNNRN